MLAVARRPRLWATALRQVVRLVPRRRPFDLSYVRFRMETFSGTGGRRPDAVELVRYLEWCRDHDRLTRRRQA